MRPRPPPADRPAGSACQLARRQTLAELWAADDAPPLTRLTDEMERMLEEFLDFARGEQGEPVEDTDPVELADTLMRDYRIFTVGINRPGVIGLRITPNLYTTLEELDALVSAIKALSA